MRPMAALAKRLERLEADISRRLEQIDQLEKERAAGPLHVDGGVPGDLPRLVELQFGRYSGPLDADGDGRDDHVRLYLQTLDQRGRFIPVVGRVDAQLVILAADRPPIVAGSLHLEPEAFDAAYRSGFMGTHYLLDVPVSVAEGSAPPQATVKLAVTDAATGAVVSRESSMVLRSAQ